MEMMLEVVMGDWGWCTWRFTRWPMRWVEMVVNMEVDKVDNMLVKIPEEEVKIVKDVKIA